MIVSFLDPLVTTLTLNPSTTLFFHLVTERDKKNGNYIILRIHDLKKIDSIFDSVILKFSKNRAHEKITTPKKFYVSSADEKVLEEFIC